jgi:hypothetical protein
MTGYLEVKAKKIQLVENMGEHCSTDSWFSHQRNSIELSRRLALRLAALSGDIMF